MLKANNELGIDRQEVLSFIGYADDYEPSARIVSLVNDYIDNYHDLLSPSFAYVIKDIMSVQGDRIILEDSIILKSKVLARLLEKCEKVAVFVLTIGNHLEDMVSHLAENGLVLQATVLDAVGSGAAEKMAAYVEDKIRRMADAKGLVISLRFSPGYCDWDVRQQKMVFRALNGDTAGISLTKTFLMIPRKSVSGIIGIGPADNDIEKYNPCNTCAKKDCQGRRK
ncbi:vitamin B12 dependent-methionine synthase activation domain-containing protein [Chloroflexota bacterium]